jgi:hypothetical protein
MDFDQSFEYLWRQIGDIAIAPEQPHLCIFAQGFSQWVEQLLRDIQQPTIIRVNQAKVQLVDKFFDWYRYVPRSHKLRQGYRGHTCIFQVFETGYQRLKVVELALTPPMLFLPPNPPFIPPAPRIAGIFLGEDLERRNEENEEGDA